MKSHPFFISVIYKRLKIYYILYKNNIFSYKIFGIKFARYFNKGGELYETCYRNNYVTIN